MARLRLGLGFSGGRPKAFPASLFNGGKQGAWYDPSDLSSMFQNSDRTTAAAVNSPVGYITDKSGNGNHAIQATAAARPILRLETGKYYLEFDGVDDLLSDAFTIAQPWDRVSAIRRLAGAGQVFGGVSANAGALYNIDAATLGIYSGTAGPNTIALAVGTNGVVTERHSGASSRIAINNGGYTTGDAGTTLPGGIALGNSAAVSSPGNARVYGILMRATGLTDAETASLRSYMADKAGVTL